MSTNSRTILLVAPFTGAWIETCLTGRSRLTGRVAPFTGAWIETIILLFDFYTIPVAPFTGAWIETSVDPSGAKQAESHPSRVRGLKRFG